MSTPVSPRKRTAVLVVHGMGSQRPLDMARGVADAVWLEGDHSGQGERRTWTHPEQTGSDIDLQVITTNFLHGTDKRTDFHESYWAHLMSETRAVAVLLWLFELAKMGPLLKPSIKALYWGAVIFLTLLVLSVSLLAIQFIVQFIDRVAGLSQTPESIVGDFRSLIYVFMLTIVVAAGFSLFASLYKRAFKLSTWSFLIAAVALIVFAIAVHDDIGTASDKVSTTERLTNLLLPILVAALVIKSVMGWWGLAGLGITLVLSAGAMELVLYLFNRRLANAADFVMAIEHGWLPWSITSYWSSVAACLFIALYLALYAIFLQPYLGDAARYFRNSPGNVAVRREIRKQAVDTLEALHLSGFYDRIIVVAHSLGTVVAYDMLRAYYSRVRNALPDPATLGPALEAVDRGGLTKIEARKQGREIVKHIAKLVEEARLRIAKKTPQPDDEELRAWLVTDFVTMGGPLTHALYLMCRGNTPEQLDADLERRTRERQFPTCPPRSLYGDGRLTFENPNDHRRYFHHGGQFALTRWTNLYFPVSQVFWGDAIGGEVDPVFGDPDSQSDIAEVKVYTNAEQRDDFFAHVLYWDIDQPEGVKAPHIVALQNAIDLADTGTANAL
jgi:pimeloyl-ACP methyl ester carboxylesterase